MKMTKNIMAVALLLTLNVGQAYAAKAPKIEFTDADGFTLLCGSVDELTQLFNSKGAKGTMTPDEANKEFGEQRQPILDILENGQVGIDRVAKKSSDTGVGAFGVIVACGTVNLYAAELREKGCTDLSSNEVVKNKDGGIELCQKMMKALEK